MSSIFLPEDILGLFSEHVEKTNLENFSLTNKSCAYYARQRIWTAVTVKNKDKVDFMIGSKFLAPWVKELVVKFKEEPFKKGELPFINEFDFIKIIRFLPNLQSLTFTDHSFLYFNAQDFSHGIPLFPSTKKFVYNSGNNPGLNIIQQMLIIAPTIDDLEIKLIFPVPFTFKLTTCPTFKFRRLHITEDFESDIFKIFPLSSLDQLEELKLDGKVGRNPASTSTFDFINTASPTLKKISIVVNASLTYNVVQESLSKLEVLNSLQIDYSSNLELLPIDFLQHVPLTLESLLTIVTYAQLEHLSMNPRPLLQLSELKVNFWSTLVLAVLPLTLKVLEIAMVSELSELESILGLAEVLKSKGVVEVRVVLTFIIERETVDSLSSRFQSAGIRFSIVH